MRNNVRYLFVAVFVTAFTQNAFATEPPKPADCASKQTTEEKDACLKQAADAVKAEQTKAADAKPSDKAKPADKPKQKASSPKCPSAEEWQKLIVVKDKEIGELKVTVAEVTKARDEFESEIKKVAAEFTAELAGANEEAASAKVAVNESINALSAKTQEAKDAENACAASFEARIRAAESNVRDAEARAQAAEAKAKAAETALASMQSAKLAPPDGGHPSAPAEPTNVLEDIRPCVDRLVASRFHKGGEEAAIKRCNERILALRSGK